MKYIYVCVLVLWVLPMSAQISSSLVTDRPDQTEAAAVVGKGVFQWETGMIVENVPTASSWGINTSLFRYGVTNNLELRFNTDFSRQRDLTNDNISTGIGALQLGFKYKILDGPFELSVLNHAILPTSDSGLSPVWGNNSRILMAHNVTEWMALGYNLGFEVYEGNSQNGFYSVSSAFSLSEQWGFFIESYGNWSELEEWEHLYDLGLTYLVHDNLQLDFSRGGGLNTDMDFYSLGLSWRFLPKEN